MYTHTLKRTPFSAPEGGGTGAVYSSSIVVSRNKEREGCPATAERIQGGQESAWLQVHPERCPLPLDLCAFPFKPHTPIAHLTPTALCKCLMAPVSEWLTVWDSGSPDTIMWSRHFSGLLTELHRHQRRRTETYLDELVFVPENSFSLLAACGNSAPIAVCHLWDKLRFGLL